MKVVRIFLISLALLCSAIVLAGNNLDSGPFEISNISTSNVSSCSATDGMVTLKIDPSQQGTSPYDISLDNGATWVATNIAPNGAGEMNVNNLEWGTYPLTVRDATNEIIYPGYAQIFGCSIEIGAFANPTYSFAAVAGMTGYTWTTTRGSITAGQNTTSVTFDFSSVANNATGIICTQPTGPSCAALATCFDFRIVANETNCSDGIDNDGDGLTDCQDCSDCTACLDSDGDGITDACDLDDDNDGIPDVDECAAAISSGLTGPLTGFTTDISTTNANSSNVPHILNSITYN
ncbi:MAG: hypothetical protein AB8F78_18380, partial [Saprospiraceae bacterium]